MSITTSLTPFNVYPQLPLGVISLSGVENEVFLQGQLTCDVTTITESHSLLGAHCDAKGKMLGILRLLKTPQAILALQAIENIESHLPQLKKYAVFSQVEISDSTQHYQCIGFSGSLAKEWLEQQAGQTFSDNVDTLISDFGLITNFSFDYEQQPRLIVIATPEQHEKLSQALETIDATQQEANIWSALDILTGTPKLLPTTQAEFVPQMQNLQMIDGISFNKGCYIGQETVARMHFRGLNKRAMFVLSATSHIPCAAGDSLEKQLGDNWRNAGTVVSAEQVGSTTVALAVLPTDIELGTQLRATEHSDSGVFTINEPAYFQRIEQE
ncbi:tRNA-modifying protein YgfZ [Alteromonadales bacterium alter-6D02]|nr:tRNA-modifying protein YgfZ [Alteromonadales bacterium alter-6D02]